MNSSEQAEIFIAFTLVGIIGAIYLIFPFFIGLIVASITVWIIFHNLSILEKRKRRKDLQKIYLNTIVVIIFAFILSLGIRLLDFIGIVDLQGSPSAKGEDDYKSCIHTSIYFYDDGAKALRDCQKYK